MRRILALAGLALAAFCLWFVFKSYTPPILEEGAVAQLRPLDVNGDRQYVLIRGHSRELPVLLFLHGGPGMPAMFLAHAFQRPLEDTFIVVHWDQRFSGKSWKAEPDPEQASTSQLFRDAIRVIDWLRTEFGVEKIYLAGHSHGSYLGALLASRRPDLLHAFIGIGQVANEAATPPLQDEFLLQALGLPRGHPPTPANRENLLFKAGAVLHGETSLLPLLVTGLFAPEYSLFDALNVGKGPQFYSQHYRRDMIDGPLADNVTSLDVPVYVFMGAYDMVTPASLAREWFETLKAPHKEWVLFDGSAHFPFFEEPELFAREMIKVRERTRRKLAAAPG